MCGRKFYLKDSVTLFTSKSVLGITPFTLLRVSHETKLSQMKAWSWSRQKKYNSQVTKSFGSRGCRTPSQDLEICLLTLD